MLTPPENLAIIPDDAQRLASGVARLVLKESPDGELVASEDWLLLNFTARTLDGKIFDSTEISGKPAVFPINQLIPGMHEALINARIGEYIRTWIPGNLAYDGMPDKPQGTLVFDFEILKCVTPVMPAARPDKEAQDLGDGLAFQILEKGSDNLIHADDIVTLDFIAWTASDGKRFHSSLEVGEPLAVTVSDLFAGLRKILLQVHDNDLFVAWIPQKLGLDPEGEELKGDLIFSVQVVGVSPVPEALKAPEDVAEPPADAQKTSSGLSTRVLERGAGKSNPKANSRVRVHYTGWTTDGVMFDSSVARNQPAEFNLQQVISGWTEGVQLMVEGEKRRMWIPEKIAYRGMPGAPAGMLVFDVELLAIL